MNSSRRIPLNPCDYLFWGQHHVLRSDSAGGNIAYMMIDLEGHIDPELFRRALAATMISHPVTLARLRISPYRIRPYWQTPNSEVEAARLAADKAHSYVDLRSTEHWREDLERRIQHCCVPGWGAYESPQVRFEQYALPDNQTRLCMHWPHYLMDAEGAEWFLVELGRHANQESSETIHPQPIQPPPQHPYPANLLFDGQSVNILAGYSILQRLRLFYSGMSSQRTCGGHRITLLPYNPPGPYPAHRLLHRHWNREQLQQIRRCARKVTPPGPARYARYLAAVVIRALHHLYGEGGVRSDAYLLTLPLRVGSCNPKGDTFHARPVPGNYLVTPTIFGRHDHADDLQALGRDIMHQLQNYQQRQQDLAQWSMMWMASLIHAWFYPLIFKLPLDLGSLSSGFSYYREIVNPLRSLCQARVVNKWGGGPLPMPPGWNPTFSTYGDELNLTLTYLHPVISDDRARRFIELIESSIADGMRLIERIR